MTSLDLTLFTGAERPASGWAGRVTIALCVACLMFVVTPALGSEAMLPDSLIVERFGREKGLPSESVTDLHLDSAGFLWIGSREGLARYDGFSSRLFEYDVGDPGSISDNYIRTIYEDRRGRLWVATNAGGLNRFDRATGKFRSFRHDPDDPKSLGHDCVFAILEDRQGQIWVGTQGGLDVLDEQDEGFEHFSYDEQDESGLPGNWIYALHEDASGRIWVATVGSGVAWFDRESRQFTKVPADPADPLAVRASLVFAIEEDASGEIWFGTEVGVYRLAAERGRLIRVPVSGLESTLADPPIVTSIAFDAKGVLWIATWNRGLTAFDPVTGAARNYRHDPLRADGIGSDRIQSVDVHGDDVWVGTFGAGVHRFSASSGVFLSTAADGLDISRLDINAVLEDREGRLWLGTFGDGLFRIERSGEWTQYLEIPGREETLASVLSLAESSDGKIWVGSMAALASIGPGGEAIEVIDRRPDDDDGLGVGYIAALTVDREDRLWVGAGGSGPYRMREDGRSFDRFAANRARISDEYIMALSQDRDGSMWIGTRSGGLYRLDPESGAVERHKPAADDPSSLSHHYVSSVMRGRDGALNVGTIGGGVDRVPPGGQPGIFEHLTVDDGLADQNVVSIIEDDDGTLWIATRRGLSRFDPETGRVRSYLLGDGIRSLEFNAGAVARGREALHFGTSGGLVSIRRGTPFVDALPSPLRLVDVRVAGERWQGESPPWGVERIEVDYGVPLSLEFAILDYGGRSRYEYRFRKRSADWIDLAEGRRLTFVDLSPGPHLLEIRGRNSRGVMGQESTSLEIAVVPPLWMTDWFRASVGILIVSAAFVGHRIRTSALKRRNQELTSLQREREAALAEAQRSERALQGAYERLRSLTRRLEDAKEEERAFIARELHDQMGQSLSAAKLDLKALGRLPEGVDRDERLADALSLVDGMIRHVRALSLDLRPPLLDELGLVAALRGYAEGQSMRTGVDIAVETDGEDGDVSPAIAITAFRIVQEAINNTLRHAGAKRVTISVRRMSESLALTVRDDGHGFDVKATIVRASRGGHLGLLGMRERVEALGGRLEIESEISSGTEVRAVVPLNDRT